MKKVKLLTDYHAQGEHEGDVVEVSDEAAEVLEANGYGKIVGSSSGSTSSETKTVASTDDSTPATEPEEPTPTKVTKRKKGAKSS